MIDKSNRKATVERSGSMVVIRMTGGPDCLWLNMYLDTADWQMTCDSDIGSYAYHWFGRHEGEDFITFCCRWLPDDHWLLRNCVDEKHRKKCLNASESNEELRAMMLKWGASKAEMRKLEEVLEEASEYDEAEGWREALDRADDRGYITLPDEWWSCIIEDYTPWQKRFAEICREVIVPELRKLKEAPSDEEV